MEEQIKTYAKELTRPELAMEIVLKKELGFKKNEQFIILKQNNSYMIINFPKSHDSNFIAYHKSSTAIATVMKINYFAGFKAVKSKVDRDVPGISKLTIENNEELKSIMI